MSDVPLVVPVGSPVIYWPGERSGEGHRSATRSEAWLLGGHTPVVMVEGYAGGIALSHVMVTADPRPAETLAGVLAAHDDPPGWDLEGDDESSGLVYVCNCGEQSERLAHEWVGPENAAAAADWHRAHVAAAVRAWLLSDERVEAAIGGISDLRDSRFQVGEYASVDEVARAALSAALGGEA